MTPLSKQKRTIYLGNHPDCIWRIQRWVPNLPPYMWAHHIPVQDSCMFEFSSSPQAHRTSSTCPSWTMQSNFRELKSAANITKVFIEILIVKERRYRDLFMTQTSLKAVVNVLQTVVSTQSLLKTLKSCSSFSAFYSFPLLRVTILVDKKCKVISIRFRGTNNTYELCKTLQTLYTKLQPG